ncbi:MAG: transcriptional regulator [Pseudomonadota bacterium]
MHKLRIAEIFRTRLARLIDDHPGGLARFARDAGLDRSALAQFLDPERLRLPRAETLHRLASLKGVSADWLLGLANAEEGRQEVALGIAVETETDAAGDTPLARWQREAEGAKIRYVPSTLPDLFRLAELSDGAVEEIRAEARASHAQGLIEGAAFNDTDIEICMPLQTLEALAEGSGIWAEIEADLRRDQLAHIAREAERLYPSVRLHLFDGRRSFSAPLTVFALKRAALYLGRSYLVVNSARQVRQLARHFDDLVRESTVPPHTVHETLARLAAQVR